MKSVVACSNKVYIRLILYNLSYIFIVVVETKAIVKARKVGGSLCVTLPKELVEGKKIREGDLLEVSVSKTRIEGFGALRGIGSFTEEDEMRAHE